MIINPTEEIENLTDDIDYIETKIEILEKAEKDGQELSELDTKALDIYTEINELQTELLEYIEEEQGTIETEPIEDAK